MYLSSVRQHGSISLIERLSFVLIVVFLLHLAAVTAFSTTDNAPDRGLAAGKSFAVSDIETVSVQNGNVMFNVPVGSLPPGRAGLTGGISLFYNSKIWDSESIDVINPHNHNTEVQELLKESEEGGWHYGYKYYFVTEYTGDTSFPYRLKFVTPDGARHLVWVGNGTGAQGNGDGNYDEDYLQGTFSGAVRLFTTDNTFIRIEFTASSTVSINNSQWTAYLPDGSRIVNKPTSGIDQRRYDRNGNYIDVVENASDSNYSSRRTTYLRDEMNRKVVIEYNTGTSPVDQDTIHAPGYGGADLQTKVVWKSIRVNQTYQAVTWTSQTLDKTLRVVDKVHLPTVSTFDPYYEFSYNADSTSATDDGWGEVSQVRIPSAATTTYAYEQDSPGTTLYTQLILMNGVVSKTLAYNLTYDGSSSATSETTTYARNNNPVTSASVTAPDGAVTTEYYSGSNTVKIVNADGSVVDRVYANNAPGLLNLTSNPLADSNSYVQCEFNSLATSAGSPSQTAIKEYTRDKNGNVTQVKDYDLVAYSSIPRDGSGFATGLPSGISSSLKRITQTSFYNDVPTAASTTYSDADSYHVSTSPRLLGLAKSVEVLDSSSTPQSRSEMSYDYIDYSLSNAVGGNLTQTKVWDSYKGGSARSYSNPLTSTNSFISSATYDANGNVATTTDGNGNSTHITYDSVGGYSYLYPTETITAYGTTVARTTRATYDLYTGLTKSTIDHDNGDLTNTTAYDDLGRVVLVSAADTTALETQTAYDYHDADRFVVVKSDVSALTDGKKVSTQFYDQLGRVRLSKTLEDASSQSATNETDGIKVQTRYATVSGYNYQLTSNPYRASTSSGATGEETMGWTRSKAWSTGHESQVETFSGTGLPAPWGSNTSSTGAVDTVTDVNATTVTDQASKVRRSITNGLGQLVRVDEPNSSGALGTVSSPNQGTSYSYDVLNNLTGVSQGSQSRTFTYSSLSRLRTAANPESGTISYAYDNNGNLTAKTDARSISTNYTYDALNRVTYRDYSDLTPDVTYTYDAQTHAKGKLTKVQNSVSTTEYTSFDIVGRVTGAKQTLGGNDYSSSYSYYLNGGLYQEVYPSGRVVTNSITSDGDLSMVQWSFNLGGYTETRAQSFVYNSAGAVQSVQLGNGKYETTHFNPRLQPTQIGLGTSTTDTSLLKLEYGYGTTANNGNVLSQEITVPGLTPHFIQNYTYDSLNRVETATETYNSSQTWKQEFSYDRYGNRNFVSGSGHTTEPVTLDATNNPAFSSTSNRITSSGYSYDSSGNTTADPDGRTFVYDAENKQTSVSNGGGTLGTYYYDGDGKRVKKTSTGENVIFIYDAAGKLIEEYLTSAPTTINKAYVYAGSRMISMEFWTGTAYLTADHLGTPRINTDGSGSVVARHDYMPFGEEISTSQRTSGVGYVADTVRKQFTSYERDSESNLDFAQARMYGYQHGRFTSPDPARMLGARMADPQHWNLYVYARNNPLILIDITGEFPTFSFSLHVRAFAPFDWFGPGQTAKGDNRGFSTDPDATYRISSFTNIKADGSQNMKYDLATTYVDPPTISTTDIGIYSWSKESPSHLTDEFDGKLNQPTDSLSAHNYGNDRAIPGSPNIDLHSNFNWSYKEQKDGSVNLTISGTVTGDQFPAAEAFIRDSKGNSVFLGVFATPPGSTPQGSLWGNKTLPMINANVTVQVKNGVFTGVLENGKLVSLDEYNKRFTSQPAAR